MKYLRLLLLLVITCLMASACSDDPSIRTLPDPVPDQEILYTSDGLSMKLANSNYEDSTENLLVTIENRSENNFSRGNFFHVETLIDGKWHIVSYSDTVFYRNPSFLDLGLHFERNSTVTQEVSLFKLGLFLPPGNYRLVKTLAHESGSRFEVTLAFPFNGLD